MAIKYPGDPPGSEFDVFTTPADPEHTPLSEAGTSDRDHPELHEDEGAAIEALESWSALRTHDHSGDGTEVATGAKLTQANTHEEADTDVAATSLHHTLGTGQYQAAPGNHAHDYNSDRIVNKPLEVCTSLTRPTSPFIGLHIWEADTNRWRVWGQFSASDIAHVGVYYTDNFNRVNPLDLGDDWNQTYCQVNPDINADGKGGGVMCISDGSNVQWVYDYNAGPYGAGGKWNQWPPPDWNWPYIQGRCIARNINPVAQHTATDNQSLSWQAGPVTMLFNQAWPPTPSSNDYYLRMSDDEQSYIRVSYTFAPGAVSAGWLTCP